MGNKSSKQDIAISASEYKTSMMYLVSGYIRNVDIDWVISKDIGEIIFLFFYKGQLFQYDKNYDQNGILYWLGTNNHTEKYENPCLKGLVKLDSSKVGIGKIEDMVDRREETNSYQYNGWSGPMIGREKNAWFTIDFGENLKIMPTCYTLQHCCSAYGLMRGWNFEGSNDGKNWVSIRRHFNDKSIQYENTIVTFQIDDCSDHYRYFRIYSTQKQHHGWWEITASLLEIYGHVIWN